MPIFLRLPILLLLCTPTFAQSQADEELALRELWSQFREYYAANDAEGVASLYAEDSDRFANISEKAVGRAEVMEQYRAILERRKAAPPTTRFKPTEITIRFLRPDVAILDGISSPTESTRVHFTVIATKEDGRWWIAAGRPRGRVED
jgi:uncharacterized protein (TIGR02246 family)